MGFLSNTRNCEFLIWKIVILKTSFCFNWGILPVLNRFIEVANHSFFRMFDDII